MVRRLWCCLFIVAALLGCEDEPDTPFVSELLPDTATRFTAARTVTVIGGRFRNGAVVLWDDQVRPAGFVSSSELLWTVPATDLLYDDTVFVSVRNPGPDSGTSNAAPFFVEGAFQFIVSEPESGVQTNVPAPIRAYFRRALDPASLTTASFAARDSATGTDAIATVTAEAATRSAVLNADLAYGRTYDIRLTTALKSERGDPLPKDTSWRLYTPLAKVTTLVPFGEIPSLALGPTGALHLAYQFGPDGLRSSTCAQNCSESASWQHDQTSYPGGPSLSLAVDGQGRKHLAVARASPHVVVYGTGSAASATWQFVDVDIEGDAFVDLKVEPSGRIHIVYFNDGPNDLRYATCAASCDQAASWTTRVVDGAGNRGAYAALAVRTDGSLHAIYSDSDGSDLRYATCSSSCETSPWQTATIDSVGSVGWGGGIGVDAAGAVHIAAVDQTNGTIKYGYCAAACTTAANWQFVPVTSVANPASGPFGLYYVRVAVHTGGVTLAYQDRRTSFLHNATCSSACTTPANWLVQRVSRNVSIPVLEFVAPSMLVDGAGSRHVTFGLPLAYIRY